MNRGGLAAPAAWGSQVAAGRDLRPRYVLAMIAAFRLMADGRPVTVPVGTQRIIARLALQGPCGRSRLASSLWPVATELKALANLRTALWRANQVAPGLLDTTADAVLVTDDLEVDVTRLVRSAYEVLDGQDDPQDVDLLFGEGELLPDWPEDWLVLDRERLRQLRLHVLEALAERFTQRHRFGSAMDAALTALRTDPLRESAHRAVIRIHLAEGNVSEARHAFDECVEVLRRELGVRPSDWTYALVRGLPIG